MRKNMDQKFRPDSQFLKKNSFLFSLNVFAGPFIN